MSHIKAGLDTLLSFVCFPVLFVKRSAGMCRCGACSSRRNALTTPTFRRSTNQRVATVLRRPRSPNRRKTKPSLTTILPFNTELLSTESLYVSLRVPVTDPRPLLSAREAVPPMLFICSKGGLETVGPFPRFSRWILHVVVAAKVRTARRRERG